MKAIFNLALTFIFLFTNSLSAQNLSVETLVADEQFNQFVELNYLTYVEYSETPDLNEETSNEKIQLLNDLKLQIDSGEIDEEEMHSQIRDILNNGFDYRNFTDSYISLYKDLLERYGEGFVNENELVEEAITVVIESSTYTRGRKPNRAAYAGCASASIMSSMNFFAACTGATFGFGAHVCGGAALIGGGLAIYGCASNFL